MIIIIGAGISGLSLAYFLEKQNKPYVLLEFKENEGQPGGVIRSVRDKEYLFELGPNSLLIDQEIKDFLIELGIEKELINANNVSKNRYVFRNGRYQKLPSSPLSLLFNGFFSWKTKFKIFGESRVQSKTNDKETLAAFFERRFSKEIVDYALDPFVSGIYAGNPQELLVKYTFPNLVEMEQKYGSLLKGFKKNKNTTERKQIVSFREGMQTIPRAIAEKVKITYLEKGIEEISFNGRVWEVKSEENSFVAPKLVFTGAAYQLAPLVAKSEVAFSKALEKVNYAPIAAVHTLYYKKELKVKMDGFGALHPSVENLFSLGHIWSSSVFEHRCKDNEVLFTTFVGGSRGADKLKMDDWQVMAKVQKEIKELYGIDTLPITQKITRWHKGIPQYDTSILEAYEHLEKLEKKQFYLCANWKDGVSLPDSIKKAKKLAEIL
ncbi:MAG: protoporphyrinogen oxidase [Thermonemataceae bacterium]|nr:protoporphyrinogen oxidase [Thermonemataceae bacterium]